MSELDPQIRLAVYRGFADTGRAATPLELAASFGRPPSEIEASLRRLAEEADALVLLPGSPYIWMAEPFSAVPTSFRVSDGGREWWGNCIWDALAIPHLLGVTATVSTACPDCGEPLNLRVGANELSGEGVVHFAVRADEWWRDIGFT